MKRKKLRMGGLFLLLVCVTILGLTGCSESTGEKNSSKSKSSSVTTSEYLDIDGIYVDESYEDEDLSLVYVFYNVKAGDSNIETSPSSLNITINEKNDYSGYDVTSSNAYYPLFTEYAYGTVVKKIYVGKTYKMATAYKVAKGDLTGSKSITFDSTKIDGLSSIKMSTDDIKSLENMEKIALDLNNDYASKLIEEENVAKTPADDTTIAKVKKAINGYYFSGYINVGTKLSTVKVSFDAPNSFEVNLSGITNSGTYEVTNGYIALTYKGHTEPTIYLAYNFDDGDITITNMSDEFGTLSDYDPLGD